MSSTICGVCNLNWHQNRDSHSAFSGQIWVEGIGYHKWQAPSKEQIAQRLRNRYGVL